MGGRDIKFYQNTLLLEFCSKEGEKIINAGWTIRNLFYNINKNCLPSGHNGRAFKSNLVVWCKRKKVSPSCLYSLQPHEHCRPPGSSIHGIFQARVLEWVSISYSRESSQSRDRTWVSQIVGRRFTIWATRCGVDVDINSSPKIHIKLTTLPRLPYTCKQHHYPTFNSSIKPRNIRIIVNFPCCLKIILLIYFYILSICLFFCPMGHHFHPKTLYLSSALGFPHSPVDKESACNVGDPGSIPGLGRSTGEGIGYPLQYSWASQVAPLVKNLPAVQETCVWSLSGEDLPDKGKATHSSILAWRIPWTG